MYTPRNILITGGCGFIGSNFINWYHKKYPERFILNIDKLDYCSDEKNVECRDSPNYRYIKTNITNIEFILHLLNQFNIDTIIHFAAQTHVDNSFGNSIQFTYDNVLGTHTLLECCRIYKKIERFIHISTDEVYGEVDLNHPGCNEMSLLNPTNPYAATKAGAEFLVRSYYHSYKLPIIITRGNNVYGSYQYPEKLIPKFIKHLLNNEKCTIHGNGETRRNFIHAEDVARAVETIVHKGEINNIYNIGTNNEYSVMEIADMLIKKLKPNEKIEDWIEYVEDRPFNDFRYAINSQSLRNLGWKEEITFEDGFNKTIEFYTSKKVI